MTDVFGERRAIRDGEDCWVTDSAGRVIGIEVAGANKKTHLPSLVVDAVTGEASSIVGLDGTPLPGSPNVIRQYSAKQYMSAVHKPLSDQISAGASAISLIAQGWSKHPFVGVRLWLHNYLNATATCAIAKAAVTDTSGADGTALTWVQAKSGNLATLSIPAGVMRTAGTPSTNDAGSQAAYDPVGLVSLPRADGGAGYLVQGRAYMSSAFNGQVSLNNTTEIAAYNSLTGQAWLGATASGDAVTTISAQTLAAMRWLMLNFEFLYDVPVIRVVVTGDSIQQGYASTSNHYSAIMRACELLDSATQYVIPTNLAIAGQDAGASRTSLMTLLASGQKPSVICRNVWSPNSALSSDTVRDTIKGYISHEISLAKELGIPYIIGTSGPVDNQSAAEYTRRYALNDWARGLLVSGQVAAVADWCPLVQDPINNNVRLAAYADPSTQSHYNDLGYGVIAQSWAQAISSVI
ncbi:MAG: SGNH/GDSL hydrolase family protein [Bellilinea sp.]